MVVNHFCNGHLDLPPEKQIRSKMVYIDSMGHVPARRVLFSPRTRDKATCDAFQSVPRSGLLRQGRAQRWRCDRSEEEIATDGDTPMSSGKPLLRIVITFEIAR